MGKDKKDKKDRKEKKKRHRDDRPEDDPRKVAKLVKKVEKHLKKQKTEDTGNVAEGLGGQKFVWTKKIQKEIESGASLEQFSKKAERQRHADRMVETEKVQQRKREREAALEQQQNELADIERQRAVAEGMEANAKEEEFHLNSAKQRSLQRLKDGRPQLIDVIVKNFLLWDSPELRLEDLDADPPYSVFQNAGVITVSQLESLVEEIEDFQRLDNREPGHADFWNAMKQVADEELAEAKKQNQTDRARHRTEAVPKAALADGAAGDGGEKPQGYHPSVKNRIHELLNDNTTEELETLEGQISDLLQTDDNADAEFYNAVLQNMQLYKAKAQLKEIHSKVLRRAVASKQVAEDAVDVAAAMGFGTDGKMKVEAAELDEGEEEPEALVSGLPEERGERGPGGMYVREDSSESEYEEVVDDGRWSPTPMREEDIRGLEVVTEEEDAAALELKRAQVRQREAAKFRATKAAPVGAAPDADRAYQDMLRDPSSGLGGVHPMMRAIADAAPQRGDPAMRGSWGVGPSGDDAAFRKTAESMMARMGDAREDVAFGGEIMLDSQVYWWHDKYRPRKPKYFNRVHTGYEWNKYNQTHYDHDNPPPKVVQGYKFNIFYPDLIDKQTAPTFTTEPDPEADEHGSTCILRFHAGPPYEDAAFRIVTKEWEYSHKKGYKCSFERGILHLYFNFKRQRYRR